MKLLLEKWNDLRKSRTFVVLAIFSLLFTVLVGRLFFLQIVHGEKYAQDLKISIVRTLPMSASRGNIYDRYGRPLAENQVAFSIKIDNSIKMDLGTHRNQLLLTLVKQMEEKGQLGEDLLPFTPHRPYSFTFKDDHLSSAADKERKWKIGIGLGRSKWNCTANEAMDFLEQKFELSPDLDSKTKRAILSLGTTASDKVLILTSLVNMLQDNGELILDDLPFSKTEPYVFLFDGNKQKEENWKKDAGISDDRIVTDEQCYQYLVDYFGIPKNFSPEITRTLLAVNYSIHMERFRKYQPVTIALNIQDRTMAMLNENQDSYPGVGIDTVSLRAYPYGEYFSHIVGYIRKISNEELEQNKEEGYVSSDLFGKSGIEQAQEKELKGTDGEMLVEVDNVGRRFHTTETKQPVSGNNVYLTLDAKLQQYVYNSLENQLAGIISRRLRGGETKLPAATLKQLFSSMVKSNKISLRKILSAAEGEQGAIRAYVQSTYPELTFATEEEEAQARQAIVDGIEKGRISAKQMVLVLYEQGMFQDDEAYIKKVKSGAVTPLSVILQKLESKQLRPGDTNLDPCTGSVVVSDVNTGEVLALVTYPSYDNNRLVNNFDNQYYNDLLNDPTTPLVNRPLSQKKAPGSTLKMVTAIAGLESGVISPSSLIKDLVTFKKVGKPYASCMGSHASINVSTALEVSCNYFFYETAYRLSESKTGTLTGIKKLDEFMKAFGLDDKTGIEIGEAKPNMASPEYKAEITKAVNPDASESEGKWVDGDTIRAAIGQSVNNYAAAHMNKYIATLANGGIRYQMHLIQKVSDVTGNVVKDNAPVVEQELEISQKNWDAVIAGMEKVAKGSRGTLRGVFQNFPISVAVKSGTAQESKTRSDHTIFVGFAPTDTPQIAVSVMIPYGDSPGSPAAVLGREIIGEYLGLNAVPEGAVQGQTLTK